MTENILNNDLSVKNLDLLKRIKKYKIQIHNLNDLVTRINGLNSFNEKLERQNDPYSLLKSLGEELSQFHEVKFCSIFLLDKSELNFELKYNYPQNVKKQSNELYSDLIISGIFGWIIKQKKFVFLPINSLKNTEIKDECNKEFISVVPLSKEKKIYGFLLIKSINNSQKIINEEEVILSILFKHFSFSFGNILYLELLNQKNKMLEKYQKKLNKELDSARNIQNNLIGTLPIISNINFFSIYKPIEQVGGDFYDFIKLSDKRFVFVIADISGHGVPAALGTATLKTALYSSINPQRYNLQKSVTCLVKNLKNIFTDEQYLTLFIGEIDILSKNFKYYSFGQFPGIHLSKKNKELSLLEANHPPVKSNEIKNIKKMMIKFDKGDKFLFLTDGVFECYNKREEIYGMKQLLSVIKNCKTDNILPKIENDIQKFVGTQPFDDDIAMVQFNIL